MIGIAIHLRRRQRRDRIGRPRPGGHDAHARPARRAGISVGAMPAPLLVPVQNEFGRRLIEFIEDRQDRPAGIAKHRVHLVRPDQHLVQNPRLHSYPDIEASPRLVPRRE